MPDNKRIPRPTPELWRRFASKIRIDGDGCWEWTGALTGAGYGSLTIRPYGGFLAHRVAYAWLIGEPGPVHDHLCKFKRCVNPGHSEPVTHGENIRRALDGWCRKGLHKLNGRYTCRECQKEQRREYNSRPENKERRRRLWRERWRNDPEYRAKELARTKTLYSEDPKFREQVKARAKAYYYKHR